MEEIIFFDKGKESVTNFFEKEFEAFPSLLMSHFLNKFNELLNYSEEGSRLKPKIVFTDNIDLVAKNLPKAFVIPIFEDSEPTMFNSRIKSILAIQKRDWSLFIDIKEGKITYGLIMSLCSIKDQNFFSFLEENTTLKSKLPKLHCITARAVNYHTMMFHSISGNDLMVNSSIDKSVNNFFSTEIRGFVDATFSKLRTTQRKLQDMKNLYFNIFTNVMSDVNGTICVIVDKDYVDNGMFEDGIWLKEPISFSKLFTQSKSYSEEKLQAFSDLLIKMLNYDGITIIDNQGRLRAYNVFVEPNSKKVGYIVGGARKRAAYYILSSKRKDIVGVYFQSHEGEVIFQELQASAKKPKRSKPTKEKDPTITSEVESQPAESSTKATLSSFVSDSAGQTLISQSILSSTPTTQIVTDASKSSQTPPSDIN